MFSFGCGKVAASPEISWHRFSSATLLQFILLPGPAGRFFKNSFAKARLNRGQHDFVVSAFVACPARRVGLTTAARAVVDVVIRGKDLDKLIHPRGGQTAPALVAQSASGQFPLCVVAPHLSRLLVGEEDPIVSLRSKPAALNGVEHQNRDEKRDPHKYGHTRAASDLLILHLHGGPIYHGGRHVKRVLRFRDAG